MTALATASLLVDGGAATSMSVSGWQSAAGGIALAVVALALYLVAALLLEDARQRSVLPTLRRGPAAAVGREPGVRLQL